MFLLGTVLIVLLLATLFQTNFSRSGKISPEISSGSVRVGDSPDEKFPNGEWRDAEWRNASFAPEPAKASAFLPPATLLLSFVLLGAFLSWASGLLPAPAATLGVRPGGPAISIVTYPLVHADGVHLAGNLAALWLLAPPLERALGGFRLLAAFALCAVAAALAHVLSLGFGPRHADPGTLVGASGAIFGLLGLFALRFYGARLSLGPLALPAPVAIAVVATVQIALALRADPSDSSAYAAHLGGLGFGAALAVLWRLRETGTRADTLADARESVRLGELVLATAQYRALLAKSPGNAELHRELSDALLPTDPDAARRHAVEAIDLLIRQQRDERAVSLAETLLKTHGPGALDGSTETFAVRLASICETRGRFGTAEAILRARVAPPANGSLPGVAPADAVWLRLASLQRRHDPDAARRTLTEFLTKFPGSTLAPIARAQRDALAGDAVAGDPPAGETTGKIDAPSGGDSGENRTGNASSEMRPSRWDENRGRGGTNPR